MPTNLNAHIAQTGSPLEHIHVTPPPKSIAIVGGGIASLTLIERLLAKQPDLAITLFCKDASVAQQGSSNRQGAIYPLLQASKSVISSFYAHAYQYAINYYPRLMPDLTGVPYQWCGVLQQAFNKDMPEKFKQIAKLWPEVVDFKTASESAKLAGIDTPYPSLFFKHGGWLNPKALTTALLNNITNKSNVDLVFNTKITACHRVSCENNDSEQSHQWLVITDNEQFKFDQVVICAGADAPVIKVNNQEVFAIQGVRGQVSSLNAKTPLSDLKTVLCHKGYVTPADNEQQCFGATFEKQWQGSTPTQAATIQNLEQIKKYYAGQTWADAIKLDDVIDDNVAIRATTPDHLPLAGQLVDWSWIEHYIDKNSGQYKRQDKVSGHCANAMTGLYCLTGLGARGLTSAPILAELVSDLMLFSKTTTQSSKTILKYTAPVRLQLRDFKKHKGKPE